ncbi:MAG: DUF5110 domain-containing protein [Verrucomicrobia bacterium]|nr:DUF5110 domain-containing protein [Verrucomicrobiota bacterium]
MKTRNSTIFGVILFLGLCSMFSVTPATAATTVGNVTGVTVTTNGAGNITASFAISTGGSVEVTPYAPDVVRVNFHWVGQFATEEIMIDKALDQWSSAAAALSDQGSYYLIETSELNIEIEKTPYKIHFKDKSGFYLLQEDFTEYDDTYNYTGQSGWSGGGISKLKSRKTVPTDQAFFGLGEYGGPMNRRGRELECWNTGTYNWGEFTNPTYLNIPFFYGVQPPHGGNPAYVYGLFFHNQCRPLFKFGTEASDKVSFQAGDGRMDYFFFGGGSGHTFAEVIDRYSELIGRPTMLPKWGLGYHLSRFSYSNQAWVEYIADEAVNTDIPCDAVYLDIDYMDADADNDPLDGNLYQLTFNGNFPNPAGMVSYCHARGVKVVPLIEPWLHATSGDPLYSEANSNLHFIKDNGSSTVTRGIYVGNVSWFDYTSSAMNSWWQGKIINWFNSVDMDGIWNDLTEPEGGDSIPYNGLLWQDGKYGDNTDSRRYWSNERNYFGIRASRQSYNTMLAKDPNERPFILGRSGNAGLQRYAVSWSGDTRANWFYHQKTIRFGMGAVIAGAAWYGNDVGGFAGSPDGELMVRSTEANCLTPFFRNHGDKSASDREPWRFGEPYQGHQRDLIKLRYRLMPYLYTLAYEATQTGKPMNVPAVFDYYEDANTHSQNDYEYLVGDYIFCAPVYSQGASSRSVYLPYAQDVKWYYWPSGVPSTGPGGQEYDGGQTVNVSAPLGDCPLFVRSGAIIPMGPSMQHANEFQPVWMDINCWPEGDSEFTLHEDDGETWDFLSGEYARTRLVSSRTATDWNFTIEARQGSYDPGTRDFYIYCMNPGTSVVQGVTKNGAALPEVAEFNSVSEGWKMTSEGRIAIKVPGDATAKAINVDFGGGIDSVQHQWPAYNVPESNDFVRVFVTRSGDATGSVNVAYATADDTAIAGTDYTSTNGTLGWTAGDTGARFFDIYITDNSLYSGDRAFTATLSSPVGAALGTPSVCSIAILEDEAIPPDLMITNPATATITVDTNTTAYDVKGVANASSWAGLFWSNALTGVTGELPIEFYWTISGIALDLGSNVITVSATNVNTTGASDSGTNSAYDSGWTDGSAGGSGWASGWDLAGSADSGFFIASGANVNNSAGTRAFGLYANNGSIADARRQFASAMTVGQELTFRFDNNWIQNGGSIGFGLRNAGGQDLLEFYFAGGESAYTISDGTGTRSTSIGWTGDGMNITFRLLGSSTYQLTVGATVISDNLISHTDGAITTFRIWNYNAGTGSEYDSFINDIVLNGGAGSGSSTSVVVTIVRTTGSLIPQAWRDRYGLTGANSGDQDDKDGDGRTNLEEYWSDTIPTNGLSFFDGLTVTSWSQSADGVTLVIEVTPPTTNSRLYDVSFASNLFDGVWSSLGLDLPGKSDGSTVSFSVTNNVDGKLYYRTQVKLP